MRLCRFNEGKYGIVRHDTVYDATTIIDRIVCRSAERVRGDRVVPCLAEIAASISAPETYQASAQPHRPPVQGRPVRRRFPALSQAAQRHADDTATFRRQHVDQRRNADPPYLQHRVDGSAVEALVEQRPS
jgi:hypothetical protein